MSALTLLGEIEDIGRDPRRGGYSRHVFDDAERDLRDWFIERAQRLGLDISTDRNGNIWAWWGAPGPDAVVTGSHLDSVPGGGAPSRVAMTVNDCRSGARRWRSNRCSACSAAVAWSPAWAT